MHIKNVIDLIKFNQLYYVVFENGVINNYKVATNDRLMLHQKLVRGDNNTFNEGYFTSNN
jgi:hypothetical protein